MHTYIARRPVPPERESPPGAVDGGVVELVGGASGRLGRPRGGGGREGDRGRIGADWEEHVAAAAAAARGEGSFAGAPSSGEGGGGDRLQKHGCRFAAVPGVGPSVNVILLPGVRDILIIKGPASKKKRTKLLEIHVPVQY